MLVSCAAYQDGKKIADIAPGEIHQYVQHPDRFVWVALREPDDAELEAMREQFELHPLAVEDAHHGHQQPKIEEYGDSLFVVLRTIEIEGGALRTGEVAVFVGRNYVLTVRRGSEQGFAEVRERCEREPHLLQNGSGYVLYALMDAVVDRYFPILQALEDDVEATEARIFEGGEPRATLRALYETKQKLLELKHTISPLFEASNKLFGGRVPSVCVGLHEYFRDIADHAERLDRSIDSLRDMVLTAISVNLSMITLQESETMKRLAAYAALVAVPTMIAGVYGMNFRHMPELDWWFGYPTVLTAMAAIDAYVFYKLRKAGWL